MAFNILISINCTGKTISVQLTIDLKIQIKFYWKLKGCSSGIIFMDTFSIFNIRNSINEPIEYESCATTRCYD